MRRILAVLCLFGALLAACGKDDSPTVDAAPKATDITVTATDANGAYQFHNDASAVVDSLANVTIKNDGSEAHEAVLIKLNDGKSVDDAKAFFAGSAPAGPPPFTVGGGTTVIGPGESTTVTQSLPAGSYAFFCYVLAPDGVPHFAKGMTSPITITGNSTTSLPLPDGENATASEYKYDLPTLKAGTTVIRGSNKGAQDHEFQVARLADGKTTADADAWFANPQGPPPFEDQGGAVVGVGGSNSFKLKATKGTYLFYCAVPDQADQKPHFMHGMHQAVTIT